MKTFNERFPDDTTCLDYLFEQAYGEMPACSRCGVIASGYYRVLSRKCYECKDCGNQIHPLAGIIFHKSSTSLKDWFYVIYLFSVAKNGVSAKEIERHLGVTYKTAWRMAKQVRLLMLENRNQLSNMYKNNSGSLHLVDHSLNVFKLCLLLKNQYPDSFDIFTRPELSTYGHFIRLQPDLYLR